ncbi:hypothetical protein BKA70DRAFT_1402945 [Coprinopsis sp. MPI-PUGE-AT-0042]|nr:hypothetical protein BKA70DRAFT_1402945 [Coprinopsis sp. MPI-PUGE-AT-0042]
MKLAKTRRNKQIKLRDTTHYEREQRKKHATLVLSGTDLAVGQPVQDKGTLLSHVRDTMTRSLKCEGMVMSLANQEASSIHGEMEALTATITMNWVSVHLLVKIVKSHFLRGSSCSGKFSGATSAHDGGWELSKWGAADARRPGRKKTTRQALQVGNGQGVKEWKTGYHAQEEDKRYNLFRKFATRQLEVREHRRRWFQEVDGPCGLSLNGVVQSYSSLRHDSLRVTAADTIKAFGTMAGGETTGIGGDEQAPTVYHATLSVRCELDVTDTGRDAM